MDLKVKPTVTLHLTATEFRLVGLALIGRIDTDEDHAACLALNTAIRRAYAHQLDQVTELAQGAVKKASEIETSE